MSECKHFGHLINLIVNQRGSALEFWHRTDRQSTRIKYLTLYCDTTLTVLANLIEAMFRQTIITPPE